MLDRLGITAASLCALHCIMLPILLPALPLFGLGFLADHSWEHGFLLATAVLGAITIFSGFKRYHKKLYPFYLLFLGVAIYWQNHQVAEHLQPLVIILGSGLIVAAHFINLKLCNSCKQCDEHGCSS